MVLWREGNPNVAMRLALAFGMVTVEQLKAEAPVFNSLKEFAEHHEEKCSAKRKP